MPPPPPKKKQTNKISFATKSNLRNTEIKLLQNVSQKNGPESFLFQDVKVLSVILLVFKFYSS